MNGLAYTIRRALPRGLRFFFMESLFGLIPDDRKVGASITHNRMVLAARYLQGDGIEIGGLSRPLPLPRKARAKQVDRFSEDGLRKHYPGKSGKMIVRPDIVDDGESLGTIVDDSLDFVIANHVIEHFPNPILFLHNACRVLKSGGILYLAIPDKEKTFDRSRPVTPFEHLVSDFENGPDASRTDHYREFVRLVEEPIRYGPWKSEEEYDATVQKLMDDDYSIHFHVWDRQAMMDMFMKMKSEYHLPVSPEAIVSSGDEVVFVFSKD